MLKLIIVFFGILICVITGLFLAYTFFPPISGRDFKLGAMIAGVLITLFSILLRAKYKWSLNFLLVSLIPIELLTILMIMSGSGGFSMNYFNLKWLLGLNFYLALPWVVGIIIGSGLSKLKMLNI